MESGVSQEGMLSMDKGQIVQDFAARFGPPKFALRYWYFTEHPYGWVFALTTTLPDIAAINASDR